jgi:uncharacterized membrane protein YqjE
MKRRLEGISDAAASVGQAGLDLLRAEAVALSDELQTSGKTFLRAVLWLLLSLFILFWALALLAYSGVEILALWLPRWGAALIVLGVLLLIGGLVGWLGWRRIKNLETPAQTVRRRLADHQKWWHRKLRKGPGE